MKPGRPAGPVRERLLSRLIINWETGCLLWDGRVNAEGYGQIRVGSRSDGTRRWAGVHRLAWELENGPIPDGLQIDHVKARGCRYRHCANVAHLEPVTPRENTLRGDTLAAANAAKTRCSKGHEYDLINTRWIPVSGKRYCNECKRTRDRKVTR